MQICYTNRYSDYRELQDAGLFEETHYRRALTFWPGIVKATSRPGFIGVHLSAHMAHIIPDRTFTGPTQKKDFPHLPENIDRQRASR